MNRLKFLCERSLWRDCIDLYAAMDRGGEHIGRAKPIEFEQIKRGEVIAKEPALELSDGAAQNLMDELWRAGLRPTEGAGTAGAMAATERHLRDLQRLVFANNEKPRQ